MLSIVQEVAQTLPAPSGGTGWDVALISAIVLGEKVFNHLKGRKRDRRSKDDSKEIKEKIDTVEKKVDAVSLTVDHMDTRVDLLERRMNKEPPRFDDHPGRSL